MQSTIVSEYTHEWKEPVKGCVGTGEANGTNEMTTNAGAKAPVFRFKLNQDVVDAVMRFAKLHQYNDRHEYKDAWKEWCTENREMLDAEAKRLEAIGYEGDVYDKLFKSGRYYFRTKSLEKTVPAERRKYVGLGRGILRAMDDFIVNVAGSGLSPADAFTSFCEQQSRTLMTEIVTLLNDNELTDDEVKEKLKKTFKNRYFQRIRKASAV